MVFPTFHLGFLAHGGGAGLIDGWSCLSPSWTALEAQFGPTVSLYSSTAWPFSVQPHHRLFHLAQECTLGFTSQSVGGRPLSVPKMLAGSHFGLPIFCMHVGRALCVPLPWALGPSVLHSQYSYWQFFPSVRMGGRNPDPTTSAVIRCSASQTLL